MAETMLRILGEEVRVACAPEDVRRLNDLAAALSARLDAIADAQGGCADARRVLVLAALGLLDEGQKARAALARAHGEIDRLNDARAEREALRPQQGAA